MLTWLWSSRVEGRAPSARIPRAVLSILVLTLLSALSAAPHALADDSPTVVRGREATDGAHPWMAALLEAGEPDLRRAHFCGATLISPTWVLTAAHCVEAERGGTVRASTVDVGLGLHDLGGDSGQRIGVRRILAHAGYERDDGLDQDIALLELTRPAVLGPEVAPMRLASANDIPRVGAEVTVMGWGETESGRASRRLREATTRVVAGGRCDAGPEIVCADGQVQDACYGDSGGPLITRAADGAWTQVGVVSYGTGDDCGSRGNYGGYASVGYFADWVATRVGPVTSPPALPSPTAAPPAPPSPEPGEPGQPGNPEPSPTCTASLRGKVRDDWGRGVAYAEVRVLGESGDGILLEANARGGYRATGLCADEYLVIALAFDDDGWPVAGAHDPDGDYVPNSVRLAEGQQRRGIDVELELSDWALFPWSGAATTAILPGPAGRR